MFKFLADGNGKRKTTSRAMKIFGPVIGILLASLLHNVKGQCNGTSLVLFATGEPQYFSSPNYPSNYPDNSDCAWEISSLSGHLLISVEDINLEDCSYDYIEVYEGRSTQGTFLGRFCSDILRPFVTNTSHFYILFTSDGSVTYQGFNILYFRADKAYQLACDSRILATSKPQTIQSANLPDFYSENYFCSWTISVQGMMKVVHVKVKFLDLKTSQNCTDDALTFYDGTTNETVLSKLCDGNSSYPFAGIRSNGLSMYITFSTGPALRTTGYYGFLLTYEDECQDGAFGLNCENRCSLNCNDSCNKASGRCINGCLVGWQGDYCDTECQDGTFGLNCENRCSLNCNDSCNKTSGQCINGCLVGWQGDYCDTECQDGTYGINCVDNCSKNCNGSCNIVNGQCTNGCNLGWLGDMCDRECQDGTFGLNCENNCSLTCNESCNKTSGQCKNGCLVGWQGDYCDAECQDGTYGINCEGNCSKNCNGSCNSVNGQCTNGCNLGWLGNMCDTEKPDLREESGQGVAGQAGLIIAVVVLAVLCLLLFSYVIALRTAHRFDCNRENMGSSEPETTAVNNGYLHDTQAVELQPVLDAEDTVDPSAAYQNLQRNQPQSADPEHMYEELNEKEK